PSTRGAAPHEVDDGQKDHGTDQRDQQRAQAEYALVDGGNTHERREEPARQHGAHDAHDDVEQYTLLRIGAHEQAGKPAEHAAHDKPDDEVHGGSPWKLGPPMANGVPKAWARPLGLAGTSLALGGWEVLGPGVPGLSASLPSS